VTARVQRATWADATRDAYEYSMAHPLPPLIDLLFPVDAITRHKQVAHTRSFTPIHILFLD
jgi:hypothetical protein